MTVQSSSFLAVLSAAALLFASGNATNAHSHKQNGTPIVAGSTHNDPVLRPKPIVAGSTHNDPIPGRVRHKPLPCTRLNPAGDCKPVPVPCPPGDRTIVNGQCRP
jgi:hypothetical protein